MENIMNKPIEYTWTNEDIIKEYDKWQDKKIISRMYGISVKEVTEILKRR